MNRVLTMKRLTVLLTCFLAVAIALPLAAKKPRKLSIGAYISGAKIAYGINSGDAGPRYEDALSLLDSCLMWYGPIPEAYYWKARVYSDLAKENRSDSAKHLGYIDELVLAADSLSLTCDKDFKDVKKKYKKECEDWAAQVDTLRIGWFGEYYDAAQDARKDIEDELKPNLAAAELDQEKASLQAEINDKYDEAIRNYEWAGHVYPSDIRYLINLSQVYTDRGDFEAALPLQLRAAADSKGKDANNYLNLLIQAGYSYYMLKQYDSAASVYKTVVGEFTEEERDQKITYLNNIVACYSVMKEYDSALVYTHTILEIEPNDAEALATVGRHWFAQIQDLSKAKTDAAAAGDDAKVAELKTKLDVVADSSAYYLGKAIAVNKEDELSANYYAIACTMKGDMENAAKGWELLTQIKPDEKNYWLSLGDTYLQLQRLEDAITPYEKAVALDDSDVNVWRNLADLYRNHNMPKKAAAAQKKVDELSK